MLACIEIHESILQEKFEITQERIIRELAAIGFGNLANVAEWDGNGLRIKSSKDLPSEHQVFVESVKKTVKSFGGKGNESEITEMEIKTLANQKVRALELLGKHAGIWKGIDLGDQPTSIVLNYSVKKEEAS